MDIFFFGMHTHVYQGFEKIRFYTSKFEVSKFEIWPINREKSLLHIHLWVHSTHPFYELELHFSRLKIDEILKSM